MKALVEASRAICYSNAVSYDLARYGDGEEISKKNKAIEELLTPISKAWSTDRANEITSLGVQIHGGMGYVEETGAAQHMRDARIAAIYEGTNGIQAIDLVGRKLQGDGGAAAKAFIAEVRAEAAAASDAGKAELSKISARLSHAADALEASTDWLLTAAKRDQNDVLAGATPYLKQFGNIAGGMYLSRGARAASRGITDAGSDTAYLGSKVAIASFYADNYLTEASGLTDAVMSGAQSVQELDPSVLTA